MRAVLAALRYLPVSWGTSMRGRADPDQAVRRAGVGLDRAVEMGGVGELAGGAGAELGLGQGLLGEDGAGGLARVFLDLGDLDAEVGEGLLGLGDRLADEVGDAGFLGLGRDDADLAGGEGDAGCWDLLEDLAGGGVGGVARLVLDEDDALAAGDLAGVLDGRADEVGGRDGGGGGVGLDDRLDDRLGRDRQRSAGHRGGGEGREEALGLLHLHDLRAEQDLDQDGRDQGDEEHLDGVVHASSKSRGRSEGARRRGLSIPEAAGAGVVSGRLACPRGGDRRNIAAEKTRGA